MNTYAFILGRKNRLSTAELLSVFNRQTEIGNTVHIIDITPEAVIAAFEKPLSRPQDSLNLLGGTVKIVEIFAETNFNEEKLSSIIGEYLTDNCAFSDTKLPYGLSVHSFTQKNEEILKKLLTKIKKFLKEKGVNSRFINKNFTNLKTAAVIGEKLIQKGAEIVLINGGHKVFAGRTIAIQDIEAYGRRDFERPHRDPRLGMLPPKVAQIMINLGGLTDINPPEIQPGELKNHHPLTLYDPFVGIGTLLTEGLLMGYSVIGSDINPEVIEKSRKNINWIISDKNVFKQTHRLFEKDATLLEKSDVPMKIDLIVTESYLGPPQSRLPSTEEINRIFGGIEDMVYKFLRAAYRLIDAGSPLIISIPAYRGRENYHFIENVPEIARKMGFHIDPAIPHQIAAKYNLPIHNRESIIYDRPDQTVAREIFKLIKK